MKLLRYGPVGQEQPGILDATGAIRSLAAHVGDIGGANLAPETLAKIAALDVNSLPLAPKDSRIGACVSRPGKLIAIGLNYSDHAAEAGLAVPKEPVVFMKATSAIAGPYDELVLPPDAVKTDWEIELAFAIGTRAKRVSEADALRHVAGYLICNDISERAWQQEREGQWNKGKSYDGFAPLGPWLVTSDEIGTPDDLAMRLSINAQTRQDGSTRTMVFKVATIVSYLSHFMTLEPGDIITTGTPPGVGLGQKPQVFLKDGDVMRLEIAGLGHQETRTRFEKA